MFYSTSALFFTRAVGISVAQLGFGLTAAAVFGIAAATPFGYAADRWRPRRVLLCVWITEAVALLSYTQVRSFSVFLPLVCVTVAIDRGGLVVFRALLAVGLPNESRVHGRAYIRAVTNLGIGAGASLGALALQADTRGAYTLMIVIDALTFLVSAAMVGVLPVPVPDVDQASAQPAPHTAPSSTRFPELRDRPYLTITFLCSVLMLQAGLFDVGIPLWVVGDTDAPRSVVSMILLLNTVFVALLQVRMSRGTEDVGRAAALCSRAGILLAVACAGYAFAAVPSRWPAVGLLMVGAVCHTVAEIWFSAGATALSFELAAQGRPGAYQGVFQTGFTVGLLLAPLFVTSTVLRFGIAGWFGPALLFAVAGALLSPATRWARATGHRDCHLNEVTS